MFWKSARTSAFLCLLFLIVYGSCNYITSLRHDVGSFSFSWERRIPFVPALIVPYMSIDLFFIAAPFFCRDDRQRRTLARQITAAILIAGACFLIMPLRLTFDRSAVPGFLGLIFNNFRSLDQPFNEFPSLHIALCTMLALFYGQRVRGLVRGALAIWFTLIAASAVLTHQHHVIDVIGGFALAVLCLQLIADEPLHQAVTPNVRVGLLYAGGALLLGAAGWIWRPWGWLLFWPAMALALIAPAYFVLGPGIFRKTAGRLSWTTYVLLAPVLLVHEFSRWYYARQSRPWDRLTEHLWMGRKLTANEAQQAIAAGVTAVVDLTCEFSEAQPFLGLAYLNLALLDLTAPTPAQLRQAVAFIEEHSATGIVYLHCKAGYSRTAAVAGAYLLATGRAAAAAEAVAALRVARPAIVIRPEILAALQTFAKAQAALEPVQE